MQFEACLPDSWWEFAFVTVTHVYNHTFIKYLKQKTPQEIFTSEEPKISHLCVFGCEAYVYFPNEVRANKLTLHSELIIFIGYKDNSYRFIYHTQGNVIFYSTQAIFDEEHFPRCPSFHSREQMPPGRLTPEIESSAPGPLVQMNLLQHPFYQYLHILDPLLLQSLLICQLTQNLHLSLLY